MIFRQMALVASAYARSSKAPGMIWSRISIAVLGNPLSIASFTCFQRSSRDPAIAAIAKKPIQTAIIQILALFMRATPKNQFPPIISRTWPTTFTAIAL
jgi:hypothetical protein